MSCRPTSVFSISTKQAHFELVSVELYICADMSEENPEEPPEIPLDADVEPCDEGDLMVTEDLEYVGKFVSSV